MAVPAPPPDQVARFRADLEALIGTGEHRIGVAVSGGPDSLALLLLAREALHGHVLAATVDHQLRPESADEAALVARLCADLGVPHAILTPEAPIEGNVQSAARAVRYRLLAQWMREKGVVWLLTAHHLDDQVETLLMRLMRGAGASGLAGVRAATRIAGCRVGRPLLGWSRAELAAIVAGVGITPVQDPSNADPRYDRARLRRHLADAAWIDRRGLARSAAALAETDLALEWMADRLYPERIRVDGAGLSFNPEDLPGELRRRLTLRILAALAPGIVPRGPELERLLTALADGATATLAGVKCAGGPRWHFEAAKPRRR